MTSRERLQLAGEHVYPVPQLDGSTGSASSPPAPSRIDPAFEASAAVAELCDRLDNLPLALELAAARTAVLSPEQILERLGTRLDLLKGGRDADPRQHTLRATIAWSFDLLDGDERELFARFAVFAGGATLEAVEEVCDADLDTLASLVDKSLVRRERRPLLDARDDPRVSDGSSSTSRARGRDRAARCVLRAVRGRGGGRAARAVPPPSGLPLSSRSFRTSAPR